MKKKLVMLILGVSATMLFTGCGVKQTQEAIKWEAGEELTLKAKDFLDISDKKADKVKLDTSDVNVDKVGEYEVVATYGKKEFTVKVEVQDTIAPKVEMKNHVIYTSDMATVTADESIDVVYDASKYETTFAGYKKVAELSELNDEFVAVLEKGVNDLEDIELETEIPTEEGIYRSALKFTDKSGNETLVNVYIVFDAPDPVVEEEVKNETTVTQSTQSSNSGNTNKGNSSNKNTTTNKNTNSGSTTNNSSNNTNSGNSGNTTNSGSTTGKPSDGMINTMGTPLTPKQAAAVNAGYYKVATSSQGYSLVVPSHLEYDKGCKIIYDYIESLGYERAGASSAYITEGYYGIYVDYENLHKIPTEDDIILNF